MYYFCIIGKTSLRPDEIASRTVVWSPCVMVWVVHVLHHLGMKSWLSADCRWKNIFLSETVEMPMLFAKTLRKKKQNIWRNQWRSNPATTQVLHAMICCFNTHFASKPEYGTTVHEHHFPTALWKMIFYCMAQCFSTFSCSDPFWNPL